MVEGRLLPAPTAAVDVMVLASCMSAYKTFEIAMHMGGTAKIARQTRLLGGSFSC
jgi:hypothetical protein